ncbi:MAG: ABC transporter ATP-binding protein, partial [Candidatus Aminicenantes bacterium]|nr:ABC transporter ATP-binding protein [Candidatus Aminicenantes bacterium]
RAAGGNPVARAAYEGRLLGQKAHRSTRMELRFELKAVTKSYNPRFSALDGINLKIYANKINALTGKSGCGKSTLARVLLRLEGYDSGEIFYKGKRIESIPGREFRKKNQVLFQNPYLSVNPCFRIRKIIAEPLVIEKKDKKEIEKKINFLLEILEIPHSLLHRFPGELSAGQLQRVVFARALVLDPEFIILDEPFSSLDEIMAVRLARHSREIFKRLNVGILFISHHLGRVKFLADHVALMEKGKIIRCGSTAEFFSNDPGDAGIYREGEREKNDKAFSFRIISS